MRRKPISALNHRERWMTMTERERYANSFFFYFAKPIEDLIDRDSTPFTQLTKDLMIYDEKEEIMRRYYNLEETQIRLTNYTASYAEIYETYIPNICTLKKSFPIMIKRLHRLNKHIRREDGKRTLENVSKSGVSYSTILPRLLKHNLYLSIRDFSDGSLRKSSAVIGITISSEEDPLDISYETEVHCIYNPIFTPRGSVSEILDELEGNCDEIAQTQKIDFDIPRIMYASLNTKDDVLLTDSFINIDDCEPIPSSNREHLMIAKFAKNQRFDLNSQERKSKQGDSSENLPKQNIKRLKKRPKKPTSQQTTLPMHIERTITKLKRSKKSVLKNSKVSKDSISRDNTKRKGKSIIKPRLDPSNERRSKVEVPLRRLAARLDKSKSGSRKKRQLNRDLSRPRPHKSPEKVNLSSSAMNLNSLSNSKQNRVLRSQIDYPIAKREATPPKGLKKSIPQKRMVKSLQRPTPQRGLEHKSAVASIPRQSEFTTYIDERQHTKGEAKETVIFKSLRVPDNNLKRHIKKLIQSQHSAVRVAEKFREKRTARSTSGKNKDRDSKGKNRQRMEPRKLYRSYLENGKSSLMCSSSSVQKSPRPRQPPSSNQSKRTQKSNLISLDKKKDSKSNSNITFKDFWFTQR